MPYDANGNYVDDCPACSSGGNMCEGMEPKRKKPLPDNDKPVEAITSNVDHVSEIVELRALVSRLKQRMRSMEPWVVGNDAHGAIKTGLADNGQLTYEIH